MARNTLSQDLSAILKSASQVGLDDPTGPPFPEIPESARVVDQADLVSALHERIPRPSPVIETALAYRNRHSTASEVIEQALVKAKEVHDRYGAFLAITTAEARSAAASCDQRRADGALIGLLDGVPIAIKDVIDMAGYPTTGGSALFKNTIAEQDGQCLAALKRAGAAVIGKTVLHEWAYGVTSDNPFHGRVLNPRAPDRIPGGSSGGSAAAVAAGAVPAALGSDTGGSVRIPAACCGIVGYKPSYDLISRDGGVPQAWSLDHIGVLSISVADAWVVAAAASGSGALQSAFFDAVAAPAPPADSLRGVSLGLPSAWRDEVSETVAHRMTDALERLADAGADIGTFNYPEAETAKAAWLMLIIAESAAYHRDHMAETPASISSDVRVFLEAGAEASAVDYLRAQQFRRAWSRSVHKAMSGFDAILTPTLPDVPPLIGQDVLDLRNGPTALRDGFVAFQWPANFLGAPSLSLPLASSSPKALPVGLMITGRYGHDAGLLNIGMRLEACLKEKDGVHVQF